jgi:hypothetical protein
MKSHCWYKEGFPTKTEACQQRCKHGDGTLRIRSWHTDISKGYQIKDVATSESCRAVLDDLLSSRNTVATVPQAEGCNGCNDVFSLSV